MMLKHMYDIIKIYMVKYFYFILGELCWQRSCEIRDGAWKRRSVGPRHTEKRKSVSWPKGLRAFVNQITILKTTNGTFERSKNLRRFFVQSLSIDYTFY